MASDRHKSGQKSHSTGPRMASRRRESDPPHQGVRKMRLVGHAAIGWRLVGIAGSLREMACACLSATVASSAVPPEGRGRWIPPCEVQPRWPARFSRTRRRASQSGLESSSLGFTWKAGNRPFPRTKARDGLPGLPPLPWIGGGCQPFAPCLALVLSAARRASMDARAAALASSTAAAIMTRVALK